MSLHTIVTDSLAGRPAPRRATAAAQAPAPFAVLLTGMSMRVLETGLALIAISVAFLIGLGR